MRSRLQQSRRTEQLSLPASRKVAYFTMEAAIDSSMPTYSGGLGVLAGDTIRAFADSSLPVAAVSLLHRQGYFYQRLTADGWQSEEPVDWTVEDFVTPLDPRIEVEIAGRRVKVAAWRYSVKGITGAVVPVYLLDTDLAENSEQDRRLTDSLYGGDSAYRLSQEVLLGIGGLRMLRALGHDNLNKFHINEGHAALLCIELLQERVTANHGELSLFQDFDAIRSQCVFTTHTPVPAGHDQFAKELVERILPEPVVKLTSEVLRRKDTLNMTHLALALSGYVNGVARKHGEVSQELFPEHAISSITNGVHARTWVCEPFAALYDVHLPGWREDNHLLRQALKIPHEQIVRAHLQAKHALFNFVNRTVNAGLELEYMTLGFARRMTAYKRPALLFDKLDELDKLIEQYGPIQIIYAGKAHPHDDPGKHIIKSIFQARERLRGKVNVVFLANYDVEVAKLVTAGVDVWINTPEKPLEASGTSGMKCALNGVPSLSILDGWWIEGCIDGVTGWAIGDEASPPDRDRDASMLFKRLREDVAPLYHANDNRFIDVMRSAIAINGSYFNTQRMVQEYVTEAYLR